MFILQLIAACLEIQRSPFKYVPQVWEWPSLFFMTVFFTFVLLFFTGDSQCNAVKVHHSTFSLKNVNFNILIAFLLNRSPNFYLVNMCSYIYSA